MLAVGNFYIAPDCSPEPNTVIESYFLEQDVRNEWWHIMENDTVIDVGAAYGSYTLPALAAGAFVVAFEPNRVSYYDLCTNINVNGFMNRCIPINMAVGLGKLDIQPYSHAAHSIQYGKVDSNVFQVAIDDVVTQYNLKPTWLKIDVEGAEMNVLKSAEKTIREHHPNILVECHEGIIPGVEKQVVDYLSEYKSARKVGKGVNDVYRKFVMPIEVFSK